MEKLQAAFMANPKHTTDPQLQAIFKQDSMTLFKKVLHSCAMPILLYTYIHITINTCLYTYVHIYLYTAVHIYTYYCYYNYIILYICIA